MEKVYNKLVRDKIPEIILSNGEQPIVKTLSDDDYKKELEKKLLEEYHEVIEANGKDRLEELADMLEVISSLAILEQSSLNEVNEIAKQKRLKRGSFDKKVYLAKVITK